MDGICLGLKESSVGGNRSLEGLQCIVLGACG